MAASRVVNGMLSLMTEKSKKENETVSCYITLIKMFFKFYFESSVSNCQCGKCNQNTFLATRVYRRHHWACCMNMYCDK